MSQVRDGDSVVPGTRIGTLHELSASVGDGLYELNGWVFACAVGTIKKQDNAIWVQRLRASAPVPKIGDEVTGRVVHVQVGWAVLDILVLGDTVLRESFSGRIRGEDVRSFDKDSVELYKCFRPGDIVKARIISLGVGRSYYLSTAANELGVIVAKSSAGNTMVPISWKEMQDPITKQIQSRKVAKVDLNS